jgi:hypothetical protein
MDKLSIRDHIARSIKEADNSYFFEDYTKQANYVLAKLNEFNLHIVPMEANDEMINAGKVVISYGATRPTDLVKNIYNSMVKAFKG